MEVVRAFIFIVIGIILFGIVIAFTPLFTKAVQKLEPPKIEAPAIQIPALEPSVEGMH